MPFQMCVNQWKKLRASWNCTKNWGLRTTVSAETSELGKVPYLSIYLCFLFINFCCTSIRSYWWENRLHIATTKTILNWEERDSRTTPYNLQDNSLHEHNNGIVWKTLKLLAHNYKYPITNWEELLPEAMYPIRTLLYISINAMPHEKLFRFPRRSSAGPSLLS